MKENLNWGLFSKYRPELYGIATVMIMIFHCQTVIPLSGIPNAINSQLNYGVDVFLLLSGISLYFSYSNDNNYGTFMKKRFDRTLIPYLCIGLFFWIWKYITAQFSLIDFLYNISGASLFFEKNNGYLTLGHTQIWYVTFIMIMYAVYPVIYKLLFNVSEKRKHINFALLIIFSLCITIFLRYYTPATYASNEVALTRIPVFLTGCYFGKAVKEKQKFKLTDYILFFSWLPLKLLETLIINPVSDDIVFHRYLGLFASFLVCFLMVLIFELLKNINWIIKPACKVLSFFGNLSLEIYIIHVLFYNALLYYMPDIRTSQAFSFGQKALIYMGLLVVSVILSVIFRHCLNAVRKLNKEKGKN